MGIYFEGIVYESELSAKWASFFKRCGWDYRLTQAVGEWKPDFKLNGGKIDNNQIEFLICIKNFKNKDEFKNEIEKINQSIAGTEFESCDIILLGGGIYQSESGTNNGILGRYLTSTFKKTIKEKSVEITWQSEIRPAFLVKISDSNHPTSYDLTDRDYHSLLEGSGHNYGASYSFDFSYIMELEELTQIWGNSSQLLD